MQTLRILFMLLIVLVGIVVLKQYVFKAAVAPQKKESAVKQSVKTGHPVTKTQLKHTAVLTEAPSPTPTSLPSTATAVPTTPPADSSSLSPYRYPNAAVSSQSQDAIDMSSSDEAQTITDWYKNIISQQGLHTTSFVQTSTNGDILNKLAAGLNGGGQITVTISKSASSGTVSISVTISHS